MNNKISKPLLNKKIFSIFFFYGSFLLIFYNYYFSIFFALYLFFEFIYYKKIFPNLNRLFYREKVKITSDLLPDFYYLYCNDLNERCSFYNNLRHNEKGYNLYENYYYLGEEIILPETLKKSFYSDDYYKCIAQNENINTSNEFLSFFCVNDIHSIENFIKEEKIKLEPIHFYLIHNTDFDNIELLFKYKNFNFTIKNLFSLTITSTFNNKNNSLTFLINYILQDDCINYENQEEQVTNLISNLFIRGYNDYAFAVLNKFRYLNFNKDECETIFNYCFNNNQFNDKELINIFQHTYIIDNLSEHFINTEKIKDLIIEYKMKSKIYKKFVTF